MYKNLIFELIIAERFKECWKQIKFNISNLLGFDDLDFCFFENIRLSSCFASIYISSFKKRRYKLIEAN